MKSINVKEARQQFAELIETARRGSLIAITRRGKKVAELSGADERRPKRLPDLTAFRASLAKKRKRPDVSIHDLRQAERS